MVAVSFSQNDVLPVSRLLILSPLSVAELSRRCAFEEVGLPLTKLAGPSKYPKETYHGVRFLVDEYDRDLVEVIDYEKPPVDCCPDLYWSREEKSQFLNEARECAEDFVANDPERVLRLEIAYSASYTDGNLSACECKKDMRTIFKWAKSKSRGLEDAVTSIFWEERRRVVKQILEFNEYLMDSFEPGEDVDEQLRIYSEVRTQRAREFAFKMAMGDALTL